MKAFIWLFKAWLLLCFGLVFFVVPLYLVAIYPDTPEPNFRFTGVLYSVARADPSLLGFIYRLVSCGLVVSLGVLLIWAWFRGAGAQQKGQAGNDSI